MTKDHEKLLNKTVENANENSKKTNENSTSGQFNLKKMYRCHTNK